MVLRDKKSNRVICQNVVNANSFLERLKGLMFTKELLSQSAVYIYPCSRIHTCFMNYNIDVLYLDNNNTVLAIDEGLKPWRIGKQIKGAVAVIELVSGKARETQIKVGQAVELV